MKIQERLLVTKMARVLAVPKLVSYSNDFNGYKTAAKWRRILVTSPQSGGATLLILTMNVGDYFAKKYITITVK